MRFGVREICNVTFRPLQAVDFGDQHFEKYQPCLFMDTATTSTIEGAATTVYAQGGRGNARLIAWEGERTVTVTFTDSLISEISFAMLSGAGMTTATEKDPATVHMQYDLGIGDDGALDTIPASEFQAGDKLKENGGAGKTGDVQYAYAYILGDSGAAEYYISAPVTLAAIKGGKIAEEGVTVTLPSGVTIPEKYYGNVMRVDYYVETAKARELTVDVENFAGYYYIEADTLFRDEATGSDVPAQFVIPRGKIQSNFTFTMAATGDPSTFDFTVDAFPAYPRFQTGEKKKVLFLLQVIGESGESEHNCTTGQTTWNADGTLA